MTVSSSEMRLLMTSDPALMPRLRDISDAKTTLAPEYVLLLLYLMKRSMTHNEASFLFLSINNRCYIEVNTSL